MTEPKTVPSDPLKRWSDATFAPFRHRIFLVFWSATLVSSFGSLIQTVGASWLMATIAPSVDRVALVQTAATLPFFFLSLLAGALADTRDRRSIMLASQSLALLASAVLAVVALLHLVTPGLLLLFTFLIGCTNAFLAPAWQASIGELVPREDIPPAVAANALGMNLARSVGPALGGFLVAALGAAAAFVANAVSYVAIIVTTYRWRPSRPRAELPPETIGTALASGLRYVSLAPQIWQVLGRCVLHAVPIAAVQALAPVVARDLLGGGAPTYGLLLAAFGVGAAAGSLSTALLRSRVTSVRLLRALAIGACVSMIGIGQSRWIALSLPCFAAAGAVWALSFANFNVTVQLSSPRWVVGRMLATYHTTVFASIALGSWLWGHLAGLAGVGESLTIAGLAALLSLLVERRLPVATEGLGPLDPRNAPRLPTPALELQPTSGPIFVTIEYRIEEADCAEFAQVIVEVGRIRRRDGARSWSICQDIDDRGRWVERFECPTWVDYLRWRTRPTVSDERVRDRLARIVGGDRMQVHRHLSRPEGLDGG